ncbi:MAG: 6-bladed beta-propeller [Acidobacteria bacterium]|nr:6-bladed beta-propeller [Acidobacteriota bacterium]
MDDFKIEQDRIYFADEATAQVCVHGLDGEWILNVGRPGQGPGEFRYPHGVCVSGPFIHVLAMRKHMVFDLEGQFLQQNGKMEDIPSGIPGQAYPGPNGTAFITICSNLSKNSSVFHLDENAQVLNSFSPPDDDFNRFWHAVLPNGFLAFKDDVILQVFCHKYEVIVFDSQGHEKERIHLRSSEYVAPNYEKLDLQNNRKESLKLWQASSYIDGFFNFGKGFVFSHSIKEKHIKFIELWDEHFRGVGRAKIADEERLVGTYGNNLVFFDPNKASLKFRTPVLAEGPNP